MPVKIIKLENSPLRFGLLGAIFLCCFGVYFFAKWSFAHTVALQSGKQTDYAAPWEIGELAVSLAPSDPQTHYALAVLYDKSFLPEHELKSLAEYETATALAPNDFRLWIALGRARERGGDAEGAEKALRKALQIAPNYSLVRWTLGNILLRQGKIEEAFAEIRRAAENDSMYANPSITTAMQIFDGDVPQVIKNIGDSPQTKKLLAAFLVKEKKYRGAVQILSEIYGAEKFALGKISNGGFESNEKTEETKDFEWQITDTTQRQAGIDTQQKRSGNNSLGFIFNSPDGKDFPAVSQTVSIEAGRKYSFETFYKSDLKTTATLQWEIVDVNEGKVLAATKAVSANADWTSLKAEFTAPENADAIIIRLAREQCKTAVCAISGRIWFDDFNFQ